MPARPAILVVRFSSLGDVILTTPLLRTIRRAHPDADVTFVTKRAYAEVLTESPYVTRLVTLEPGESVRTLAARLRAPFAWRLDLHGSLRSYALRMLLGGRWSSYPKRRRMRRRLVTHRAPAGTALPHVAERYFHAARGLGVTPDGGPPEVHVSAAAAARAAELAPAGAVVLAPGSRQATKRWPPERWHALAERLLAKGYRVIGLGSVGEERLLDTPGIVPAFGLPLGVAAGVLAAARVAVANDSGLMHLATAVGTPVVALFGPTVRALGSGPYRAPSTVVERPLGCRPCSPYGGPVCPLGHHRCMIEIAADEVETAVLAA
jgi:heptosyltransferase-2